MAEAVNGSGSPMSRLHARLARARDIAAKPFAALCYAPFAQLHFMPSGGIAVCSKSTERVLGNVATDRILDVWRGARIGQIRRALSAGEFAAGCDICRFHLCRENVRNNPLLDFDRAPVDAGSPWPTRLSFAFSDLCNLACIQCSPEFSSLLRARAGLPARPPAYGDDFFEQLEELLPHVRSISFLGGEPFLQPEVHRTVELVAKVGASPDVFVTTNGTVWNGRVERMLDRTRLWVSVSFDGATAATFERIRAGARFDRVLENARRFRDRLRSDGRGFRLNFCLMTPNWHEFPDFLRLAEELDAGCWVTIVTRPPRLSLLNLRPERLSRIVDQLEARSDELSGLRPESAAKWHETLRSLRSGVALASGQRTKRAMPAAYELARRGHPALAARAAAQVPAASALHAHARVFEAEKRIELGELDRAEALLATAVHEPGVPPSAYLRLAWLRFEQGRAAAGLAAADRLARRLERAGGAPRRLAVDLLVVRAHLHRLAGDLGSAIADVRELIELEPEVPTYRDFLTHLESARPGGQPVASSERS